ncbi:unnamed protein product [Cylicocyclus nassatus]|uniref:Uncharacterized protein n=1 Tax=Cylicocyclus nassatus TaxID=53992 RepID=A0AA36MFX7_CYLNA|nr:unnamed protein product [Cylicocyclus nassatus]
MVEYDPSDDHYIQSRKVQNRIEEMDSQLQSLHTVVIVTFLITLLMIIFYVGEVICSPAREPIIPPPPTAVVIHRKDRRKKKRRKTKKIPKDECRHTLNRSFPSKKIMLELDVKKTDKKKKEMEEKEKSGLVKIPIGAPPPYVESGKGGTTGDVKAVSQPESSAVTATVGSTISGVSTTSLPVSATQQTSGSQDRTVLPSTAPPSQPPQLDQLKTAILSVSPRRARPGMGSTLGQPSLPVPAQPPTRTVLPMAKSPRKGRRRATATSPRRSQQMGSGSDQPSAQ